MKIGEIIKFNMYGHHEIEGEFIRRDGDRITVKITKDKVKDFIGEEQSIHKDHLISADN